MGLFNRMKDPVEGTAQVVSSSQLTERAVRASCRIQVVLQAPGMEAHATRDTVLAPTKKWPWPGSLLPVRIDRANPDSFKVLWKKVETVGDQAARQAQAMADSMNRGTGPQSDAGVPPEAQQVIDQLGDIFPGATVDAETTVITGAEAAQAMQAFEEAVGQDLDGDGVVGASGQSAGSAPSAPEPSGRAVVDRIEALERLAGLHQSGALSDEEFAAEKQRLLGR